MSTQSGRGPFVSIEFWVFNLDRFYDGGWAGTNTEVWRKGPNTCLSHPYQAQHCGPSSSRGLPYTQVHLTALLTGFSIFNKPHLESDNTHHWACGKAAVLRIQLVGTV